MQPLVVGGFMFESLYNRDFSRLWVSNLLANFAMQMQMMARGWVIYDMTSSPMALTWVMLSFMLPFCVFSLAGGLIADRFAKRDVMLYGQLLNFLATLMLAVIIYTGNITFVYFLLFGIVNGTVMALSWPARSALVPEVVGETMLVNAMALQSATQNLSRILGPVLAGLVLAYATASGQGRFEGASLVFFLIAVLFALSAVSIFQLPRGKPDASIIRNTPVEDIVEGFRFMRDQRLVTALLLMGFVPLLFGFAPTFLLPAFSKDVLAGGPDDLGFLMTGFGCGALAGSLVLARLGDVRRKGRIMFATAYCWVLAITVFAFTDELMIAAAVGAVTGLAGSMFGALNMSLFQMSIEPGLRGRIMAILMMTHGLMPVGLIPISAAAEYVGIDVAILISAALLLISVRVLDRVYPELRVIDRGHSR